MESYHDESRFAMGKTDHSRQEKPAPSAPRTRPATWIPRRAYYVYRYLRRVLTVGTPTAISNKQIQVALGFGSEGEISQIMRWLGGDVPLSGRWAYGALTAPQIYRFIARERTPSGAYLITLLLTPTPIAAPPDPAPEGVQLSLWDDPPMIPLAPLPDALGGGSSAHDPPPRPIVPHQEPGNERSQGDHPKETHEDSDQEEESRARELFDRLLAQPGMDRTFAQRVVQHAPGTRAEFEADVRIAQTIRDIRSPFFFTVARWRDGQRVEAPERLHDEQPITPAAADRSARARRRAETNRGERKSNTGTPEEYAALLAEIATLKPITAEELGLPVRGGWRTAGWK